MKSTGRWLAMAAVLIGGMAQAQDCREQLPQILANAYSPEQGVVLEQVVCKVWPARSELTLVAVPLVRAEDDGYGETDLELLVVGSVSGQVSMRSLLPGALDWDAIYVSGIAFDTAPYWVSEKRLAFGVRVSRENSSRAYPFSEQSLNLYVLDGDAIRPVLSDLVMAEGSGEWDTGCTGEWNAMKRTLALAEQPGPSGYNDIILREKRTFSSAEVRGDECASVEENRGQRRHRLAYDGERYVVPKELQRLR
ncbi:hypothetical protein [Aquipseudomonas alcaligenes]|uniref:hypothetical protein n=1 Tax=Aquipseudomonas alcaligenes TaxID=43263 RepID=UPI003748BB0F